MIPRGIGPLTAAGITRNTLPDPIGGPYRYRWFVLYACGCNDLQRARHRIPGRCVCHDARVLVVEERRLPAGMALGHMCDQVALAGVDS